jgi:hypothetical protein
LWCLNIQWLYCGLLVVHHFGEKCYVYVQRAAGRWYSPRDRNIYSSVVKSSNLTYWFVKKVRCCQIFKTNYYRNQEFWKCICSL